MTVIRPNAISGITSLTAQGDAINFFKSDGTSGGLEIGGARINATGISTFTTIKVGTAQTLDASGINVTGVITATSFKGDGSTLTGVAATSNISTNAIVNSGFSTFSGGVSVTSGGVNVTGVITATSFSGSGANLTGLAATANVTTSSLVVIGVSTVAAGSAAAPSITPTGDSDTGIFFPSADTIAFGEGGSEAARIDSSGRFGIGIASPEFRLDIKAATDGLLRVNNSNESSHGSADARIVAGGSFYQNPVIVGSSIKFNTYNGSAEGERARIDSSGRLGIGVTSPAAILQTQQTSASNTVIGALLQNVGSTANTGVSLDFAPHENTTSPSTLARITALRTAHANAPTALVFSTFNSTLSETARLDPSGRLLVGTSSARSNIFSGSSPDLQVETTSGLVSITRVAASGSGAAFVLAKTRSSSVGGSSSVVSGDDLGQISFQGADGTNCLSAASITAQVDGTPGTNDMPGRLVFSTTADGASSPTERMRIKENGRIFVQSGGGETYGGSNPVRMVVTGTSDSEHITSAVALTTTYSSQVMLSACYRTANSIYNLFSAYSGNGSTDAFYDREFTLRGDGNGYADGSWNGGGADYAEFFEWSDSNTKDEDRRGISVVLDGNKIREAVAGEDPIGVISSNPSVVGDAAWNKWSGKYLRDEFGSYLLDENGDRQLNPAFDPAVEYIPREQRPEWDCVGLMGKLRIRKGQITGSRWIKMRDISETVEEWLVR